MATPDQKAWAHGLVAAFRTRTTNVAWFHVRRARVADELDARIDAPENIYQSDTQWCGYASILYEAVRREPQNYAWYVICLFESGRAQLNFARPGPANVIEVSEGVRRAPLPGRAGSHGRPAETMPQADYIGLAGLRDHFKTAAASVAENIPLLNLIKDIHGSGGGELCNALKKLGCENAHDQSTVFTARDLGYLNAASGHYDRGRIVILLIDGSLFDHSRAHKGRGSHWVALASSVTYSPDKSKVKFEVYSWGKTYTVDETAHFVQIRFFGYVVGY